VAHENFPEKIRFCNGSNKIAKFSNSVAISFPKVVGTACCQ
jgi:hypothetical protein